MGSTASALTFPKVVAYRVPPRFTRTPQNPVLPFLDVAPVVAERTVCGEPLTFPVLPRLAPFLHQEENNQAFRDKRAGVPYHASVSCWSPGPGPVSSITNAPT